MRGGGQRDGGQREVREWWSEGGEGWWSEVWWSEEGEGMVVRGR